MVWGSSRQGPPSGYVSEALTGRHVSSPFTPDTSSHTTVSLSSTWSEPNVEDLLDQHNFVGALDVLNMYPYIEWTNDHRRQVFNVYDAAIAVCRSSRLVDKLVDFANGYISILDEFVHGGQIARVQLEEQQMESFVRKGDIVRYLYEFRDQITIPDSLADEGVTAYIRGAELAEIYRGRSHISTIVVYHHLAILYHHVSNRRMAVATLNTALDRIAEAKRRGSAVTGEFFNLAHRIEILKNKWANISDDWTLV